MTDDCFFFSSYINSICFQISGDSIRPTPCTTHPMWKFTKVVKKRKSRLKVKNPIIKPLRMPVRKTNICAGFRFPANSVTRQVPIVGNAFVKHQPSHCHPRSLPPKVRNIGRSPDRWSTTLFDSILIFIDFGKIKENIISGNGCIDPFFGFYFYCWMQSSGRFLLSASSTPLPNFLVKLLRRHAIFFTCFNKNVWT